MCLYSYQKNLFSFPFFIICDFAFENESLSNKIKNKIKMLLQIKVFIS